MQTLVLNSPFKMRLTSNVPRSRKCQQNYRVGCTIMTHIFSTMQRQRVNNESADKQYQMMSDSCFEAVSSGHATKSSSRSSSLRFGASDSSNCGQLHLSEVYHQPIDIQSNAFQASAATVFANFLAASLSSLLPSELSDDSCAIDFQNKNFHASISAFCILRALKDRSTTFCSTNA